MPQTWFLGPFLPFCSFFCTHAVFAISFEHGPLCLQQADVLLYSLPHDVSTNSPDKSAGLTHKPHFSCSLVSRRLGTAMDAR